MMEKIRSHFLKFGARRFVLSCVGLLVLTDLLNCYFLKLYWVKKDFSAQLVLRALGVSSLTHSDLSSETFQELRHFLDRSFLFIVLVILANNVFFYYFYLQKKLWAQGFVLVYCLTAGIFSLTFVIDHADMGAGWMAYNILTIPLYVYLCLGVKVLKPETTLAPKKKER
jgi:hypothetical protein